MNRLAKTEMNFLNNSLTESSLIAKSKPKLEKETSSPLNSWFRQQGGSFNMSKQSSSSNSLFLPKLKTSNDLISSSSNSSAQVVSKSKKEKSSKFNSSTNLRNNNTNTNSIYFSTSSYMNMDERDLESRDYVKTPQPANSYYQQCIDDVFKSNQPEKLKLTAPRELKYVRSIPFFKYVTFGSGKSFNCIWQIEIFKD